MNFNLKRLLVSLFLIGSTIFVKGQSDKDSIIYTNTISVDLLSLYYDFFDTRTQIRLGAEYEKQLSSKIFFSVYLDAGLYDKYTFIEYYDFFYDNGGLYSVNNNVTVTGLHFRPGLNYFWLHLKRRNLGFFIGGTFDYNLYRKNIETVNSKTQIQTESTYFQNSLGFGFTTGAKFRFYKQFSAELKTSIFTKLYSQTSKQDAKAIRPLNAMWTDDKYKYWWYSEIKIGYDF